VAILFALEVFMQAIRTHVAGIDVHKDVLAITVLI